MKFGEKVRALRKEMKKTQEEVAKELNIALRTYKNYELCQTYPKKREVYYTLAEYFGVNVNYLFTEDEAFIIEVKDTYGPQGMSQAQKLIQEVSSLFSGGKLEEEERDMVMRAIQDIYWEAKEENKRAPKE